MKHREILKWCDDTLAPQLFAFPIFSFTIGSLESRQCQVCPREYELDRSEQQHFFPLLFLP